MSWRAAHVTALGAMLFGYWPAMIAQADDQQLVENYLQNRGVSGAVVRPVTDDFVGRTFPGFSFFGVIFRQYPVAVQCPPAKDLKCANLFFVEDSQVDFVSTIEDLKFFFAANLAPTPTQDMATDAASTLEEAEETAWTQIEQYVQGMNPYDLQKLVAALLRAMGYHVSWIAPPGPDKGIDLLAHNDPLGTSTPRIKVQVKRRADL